MHSTPPTHPPMRFFNALLRFFSSIRVGIALIFIIIVYSAIGSAIPPARQYFELTEFQFFNHWIFGTLIGLFCVTLITATVRRIPFSVRNLGVLTVHAGLLMLCAASFVYFGQKIEGDVVLLAPSIKVLSIARFQARQNPELASFAAFEGKRWSTNMPAIGGQFDIHVVSVTHKGMETVSEAELDVKIGDGPVQRVKLSQPTETTRQLDPKTNEAHPDFAKISDAIALQLKAANVEDHFLDQQTATLVIESDGQTHHFDLPQLPYYQEIIAPGVEAVTDENRAPVRSARSSPIPILESWAMPISVIPPESTAAKDLGLDVTIDAYLPYVDMDRRPVPGGTRDAPAADLSFKAGEESTDQWLFGSIPAGSMYESRSGTRLEFRWLDDRTELDPDWTRKVAGKQVLDVIVKDKNISRQYEVTAGQTIPIEGTEYVLTVEQLLPSWPLMTATHKEARTPTALVWVKSGSREFQRSVLQRYPELNQDRDRAGKKILDTGGLVDENLVLKYADCTSPHFLVAAGRNLTPTAVYTARGGTRTVRALTMGKTERFDDGNELSIRQIIEKPRLVDHPVVVPPNRRRPFQDVRRSLTAIHVKLTPRGRESEATTVWIPFSYYNATFVDNPQMVPPDTAPTVVNVGDRQISLIYGRARRRLPAPITLERLKTDFHPGGQQQSGWESFFRYEDPTEGTMHTSCWLNNTAKIGDYHLFQNTHAPDEESYTGLGVGNRRGVVPMLLGCVLISIGMVYAFTVKPMLIRRMKRRALEAAGMMEIDNQTGQRKGSSRPLSGVTSAILFAAFIALICATATYGAEPVTDPAAKLRDIQSDIDTQTLGAIVVQYNARFSSLEAWARDHTQRIAGAGKQLMGLQPTVAAIEMMFNSGAYADVPIIFVKDLGIRQHLTSSKAGIDDAARAKIKRQGLVSRAYLDIPEVHEILVELSADTRLRRPMGQLLGARAAFDRFGDDWLVVPAASSDPAVPWHHPNELIGNLAPNTRLPRMANSKPLEGVTPEQAEATLTIFRDFVKAWQDRDVAAINSNLEKFQKALAAFAPNTYPTSTQRVWEVKYYRMNLVWWSWLFYILTFFMGVFATGTGYRWARRVALALLTMAILIHAGEIGVRWYVIGRIPVANMYEAVVSSTFVGAIVGLILELVLPRSVFALASGFLGMFTLALPELNVLGVSNSISTMAPILDDVMLRIHTVLIISSYAVIALAFAVSNCYLFLAARGPRSPLAIGTIAVELVAILGTAGYNAWIAPTFTGAAVLSVVALAIAMAVLRGMRVSLIPMPKPMLSLAAASAAAPPMNLLESAGGAIGTASAIHPKGRYDLFREFDRCQCILIYIATIALFVGIVLGAVWADYSWGRPWGWDPKEVFALNTWLVYAILIHARFVSKDRALWTAVLSIGGFAAMQFNWWVVNFYIVGLHSYA